MESGDHLYFCGELEQAHFYAKALGLELLTSESAKSLKGSDDPSALENGDVRSPGGVDQSAKIVQVLTWLVHFHLDHKQLFSF